MSRWRPQPDPAIHDPDRPGLRPHVHEQNRLWPWVFQQGEVWVDYWGNEHEIALMASMYLANVITFCQARSLRIALLVLSGDAAGPLGLDEVQTSSDTNELGDRPRSRVRVAEEWLETTVLIRAIRAELERRDPPLDPQTDGDVL